VLKIYDDIRRPFAGDIVERSYNTGMLYELLLSPPDVKALGERYKSEQTFDSESTGIFQVNDVDEKSTLDAPELDGLTSAINALWSWQMIDEPEEQWSRAEVCCFNLE